MPSKLQSLAGEIPPVVIIFKWDVLNIARTDNAKDGILNLVVTDGGDGMDSGDGGSHTSLIGCRVVLFLRLGALLGLVLLPWSLAGLGAWVWPLGLFLAPWWSLWPGLFLRSCVEACRVPSEEEGTCRVARLSVGGSGALVH